MLKRGKVIILLACLPILAVLAMTLPHRELRYKGKSITQWLHPEGKPAESLIVPVEAQDAILKMGTNAIPTALRWISYERSDWTPYDLFKVKGISLGLLQKKSTESEAHFVSNHIDRALDGENIFVVLGPIAQPAIPELTRLAVTSSDEQRLHHCVNALSYTGSNAIPALLNIITNAQTEARCYAISLLPRFQTSALPAVPILVSCAHDENTRVASAAKAALGQLSR